MPDWVRVLATPRGGTEVELGRLDVIIRRRIEVTVPAGVRELVFRTEQKNHRGEAAAVVR